MYPLNVENWTDGAHAGDLLNGVAAGLIAGLVATIVMTQMQNLVSWAPTRGESQDKSPNEDEHGSEPATETVARGLSEKALQHELSEEGKATAGEFVHYGFGTTMGGLYGAAAEIEPTVTVGKGLVFGTVPMLLADKVVIPAAHLSPPPNQVPVTSHAYALTSHLLYGFTAEMVRKAVRQAL